ncbi:MAG: ATP-binding protein [Spirochaetes bacterium]|nr:ATP-binding protein [Spirochaetota bacterium]
MLELADHILDISENSVRAGAKIIEITIEEDSAIDLLTIVICDDGRGIKQEEVNKVKDPFFTTKRVRRVGLGLPLLAAAAEMAGGSMNMESAEGKGTKLTAVFKLGHLDRQPIGNIEKTLIGLIAGNSEVDFCYKHRCGKKRFMLDTRVIRREIEDVPLNHPEVLKYIRSVIKEGLGSIESKA